MGICSSKEIPNTKHEAFEALPDSLNLAHVLLLNPAQQHLGPPVQEVKYLKEAQKSLWWHVPWQKTCKD